MNDHPAPEPITAIIEVSGVNWASEEAIAEAVLSRRPGVLAVDVNPVAQTATVTYEPNRTSVRELSEWVRDCGFHCAGQSVPRHICDPLVEPHPAHPPTADQGHSMHAANGARAPAHEHAGHVAAAPA